MNWLSEFIIFTGYGQPLTLPLHLTHEKWYTMRGCLFLFFSIILPQNDSKGHTEDARCSCFHSPHWIILMQALADPSNQEDCLPTMTLSTCVYTIMNVKNHNWAMLVNDNDRSDVISGNSTHKDAGEKVTSANFYKWQLNLNYIWCSGILN